MRGSLIAVLLLFGLAACGPTGHHRRETVVAIVATGEAKTRPDVAEITGGIESRAPTAKEALATQATKMTAIVAAVAASGVKADDVETAQISLNPVTDWTPRGGQRIRAYSATNIVVIKVRDLAKVGAVLDAIVADGGNRVDSVVFKLESEDAAEASARADAMRKAQARAEAYAKASGLKVGRIISIREDGAVLEQPGAPWQTVTEARAQRLDSPASPVSNTPTAAGAVDHRVQLQVNYELRRK